MKRPWNGDRFTSALAIWLTVLVLAGSFIAAQANWGNLLTVWTDLPALLSKDNLWPPTFGVYSIEDVMSAILITFQVAFAATLMGRDPRRSWLEHSPRAMSRRVRSCAARSAASSWSSAASPSSSSPSSS